ncbi:MAG TPA: FAD-dependent oxidoreductase [Bryobacteraceae bacterium]|nr:FAD-dependent oxidoreductase [Bryobacteraceae bacterium]
MATDAIVVGAGIIGGSIAWRLSQLGLRVCLVDAGRVGGEASWAGAGMLAPGGEIEERTPWADFAVESLRLYPRFIEELEAESGLSIDYQRLGAVEVVVSPEATIQFEARARLQAELGIPSFPLGARQMAERVPLARKEVAAVRFYPEDAIVDPRDVMHALHAACLRRGVEIREGWRVDSIRPEPSSVEVISGNSVLRSTAAVLAAGAWSSQIAAEGFSLPVSFPVRGHLIGFYLEPGSLGPILRSGHTYMVQRANGFTIAGSTQERVGFNRTPDPALFAAIHQRAAELIPLLAGRAPDESWIGFRPALESGSPAIGRLEDTALWLAYGHFRNGILLAPATAGRMAGEITTNSRTGSPALPCTK